LPPKASLPPMEALPPGAALLIALVITG
jgi:hypothetical protein